MRPCHSFLRREGVLGIGHLVVVLFRQCISSIASYAIDDVGGGARKTLEQKFIFQIGTLSPIGNNERFSFY